MPGLDKLLKGILLYRSTIQPHVVKQFKQVKDNPQVRNISFRSDVV